MKIVIFSDIHYSDNYKYENEPIKSRKCSKNMKIEVQI